MKIHKTSTAMSGIKDALKVIELAADLKMQVTKIRGIITAHQLDELMADAVRVVHKLHIKVKEGLAEEEK